jgi:hypothetical protein
MGFRLRDLGIEGLDYTLAEGLLAILAAPRNASGFIPALGGVSVSLRKLSDSMDIDGLASLRDRIDRVRVLLAESDALGPSIRAMPDIDTVSPSYRLTLKIVGHGVMQRSDVHNPDILSILGAIFLWHLLASKPLPKVRAEQLLAVMAGTSYRSPYRHHWCDLAEGLNLDPDRIVSAIARIAYEPAKDLGRWIVSILRNVKSWKVPKNEKGHPLKSKVSLLEYVVPAAPSSTYSQSQLCDSGEAVEGSLVRWSYQRAVNASIGGSAGLCDWTMLTPKELKRVATRVADVVKFGAEPSQRLGLVALLSLATGLPAKMALRLPFSDNGDVWIDVESGECVWDIQAIVTRERLSNSILAGGWSPGAQVRCALPKLAANSLSVLLLGDAPTLRERLFGDRPMELVVSQYGDMLRSGSEEDARRPYAARWAYSLGAAIVEVTGDSTAAAYCSLDFRFLAGAEPYYLCMRQDRIYDVLSATYSWLGFDGLAGARRDGYIGSPLAPRPDVYRRAAEGLAETVRGIDPHAWRRQPIEEVVRDFNRRALAMAALYILLVGERGTALERRTVSAMFGHAAIAIVSDKQTDGFSSRPIPLTKTVHSLLNALRSDVAYLATLLSREGVGRSSRLHDIARLKRQNAPILFTVSVKNGKAVLSPIRLGGVETILGAHGVAHNAGRHYLISALADKRYPMYLRRALSGHGARAGAAYHSASGISPAVILSELRQALEDELRFCCIGDSWNEVDSALQVECSSAILSAASLRYRVCPSVQAYVSKDRRGVGRSLIYFSLSSAATYSQACRLRLSFLSSADCLGAAPALILSLVLVEGVNNSEQLTAVWAELIKRRSVNVGASPWCEIVMSNGRRRVFSPLKPTLLALNALFSEGEIRESFETALADALKWVRASFPNIIWPASNVWALEALFNLGRHLAHFELPPWLAVAENPALPSASVALSALVRRDTECPLGGEGNELGAKGGRSAKSMRWALSKIISIVNDVANPVRRYGEDRARKVKLKQRLYLICEEVAVKLPMVDAVIEYLVEETCERPSHGESIVVGTMAAYMQSLASAFDKRAIDHPLEFTDVEWEELYGELKRGAERRGLEFDPSPLRRFARYWKLQGVSVPDSIFPRGEREVLRCAEFSAASRMVWDHEWEAVTAVVLGGLNVRSARYDMADCYLRLIREGQLRAREAHYIRLIDFDRDDCKVIITSSGFGHLKGGDRSRGYISLSSETSSRLSNLRRRLKAAEPARQYFFFSKKPTEPEFVFLIGAVSRAMRQVTGDDIRRHSLRGFSECDLLLDGVDKFVKCYLDGRDEELNIKALGSGGEDAWRSVVMVSSAARHHPLTAISTYLVIWPLVSRYFRERLLDGFWPGANFAKLGSVSPIAMRVYKHRLKRDGLGALAAWRRMARSVDINRLAFRKFELGGRIEIGCLNDHENGIQKSAESVEVLARVIWYGGLVRMGVGAEAARDLSQCDAPSGVFKVGLDPIPQSGEGVRLMIREGAALALAVAAVGDAGVLRGAKSAVEIVELERASPAEEVVHALRCLVKVIPHGWIVALLPEYGGLPIGAEPQLRGYAKDILIKSPSREKGKRYKFVVAPRKGAGSPRVQGGATAALSALLQMAIDLSDVDWAYCE